MLRQIKLPFVATIAVLALLTGISSLALQFSQHSRTGYVLIGKVMQDFEMKKEYEMRLQEVNLGRKKYLDSLKFRIDNFYIETKGNKAGMLDSLKMLYDARANEFNESSQNIAENYNKEVMEKINALVKEYAEDKGYDLVLGADGSGNLMYARQVMDVTTDFVAFANNHYKQQK